MIKKIKRYFWFIAKSQSFLKGTEPGIIIFFKSIPKGFEFVKMCDVADFLNEKYGADTAYAMMDRRINFDKEVSEETCSN